MFNKIRKNRTKSSIVTALMAFVAAMVIWPLFDLFWMTAISHHEFHYYILDYVIEPAIFAIIFGLATYFLWKPETKLEKKASKHKKSAK